ncbi:MAG: A/G-specific adenine glycosylase [Hyphomicrobiaceae bacterium]|nr:A/G-specific adenine glycosylase [Hyphomicrobiaceae bacterium]MCC0023053.1 A/G-specific adenine glycosylase [Hyphomicrobiaceae bacterium]
MPSLDQPQTKKLSALSHALLTWYDGNARSLPWRISPSDRRHGIIPDPYRVWLSEVMLQQTTVPAVRDFFQRFTDRWPSVHDLAAAEEGQVMAEWAGLGYYARARNLHACAKKVAGELDGVFPKSAAELQTLPGIGPYTAAAISAICHDERVGVLDGNVERVLARFHALSHPVRDLKPELREALTQTVPERAGDYAQALMDLGATICAPRAAFCDRCPLLPGCRAAKADPLDFPVRPEKKPRPSRFGHVFVMRDMDGRVKTGTRPRRGLLGGMHEFPGSDWTEGAEPGPQFPVEGHWKQAGKVHHVFTHFALTLTVWRLDLERRETGPDWVDEERLGDLALPSLFRKVAVAAGLEIR